MRWAEHVAGVGGVINSQKIVAGKPQG